MEELLNGYTIKSVSKDGTYYLAKDWRKYNALWVKRKNIHQKYLYLLKSQAVKGMQTLLKTMPEFASDKLTVVFFNNGEEKEICSLSVLLKEEEDFFVKCIIKEDEVC